MDFALIHLLLITFSNWSRAAVPAAHVKLALPEVEKSPRLLINRVKRSKRSRCSGGYYYPPPPTYYVPVTCQPGCARSC
ncbi:hypothetical protein O181_037564 [Austropuccinia psidii MF-1]|uniref:Uncharacterized protein n=1 Tax=Austropuccinia psidii MF-1 TaxID=1389203 RepID=A0A9Q3D6S8_9BASI|nr:hypothetical protein [Austropuccinia psidii MF-1]